MEAKQVAPVDEKLQVANRLFGIINREMLTDSPHARFLAAIMVEAVTGTRPKEQ